MNKNNSNKSFIKKVTLSIKNPHNVYLLVFVFVSIHNRIKPQPRFLLQVHCQGLQLPQTELGTKTR